MKTCPHCGAQISETAKFCSECGYCFNGSAQLAKAQTNNLWIKFIPNVLFLVFALSLFGVFAESVISGISASVYLLCDSAIIHDSSISFITVLSILLVIFAVFTVIAAVVTAAVKYVAYKDGKPISSKTDWISFACYILYFLIGFIMCVVIESHQALYVGACPVWLIVLSIIFMCLLGAYCLYIKYNATATARNVERNDELLSTALNENKPNNETTDNKKANRKKRKAILPEVFLLVFAVIMLGIYFLPFVLYYRYSYDYNEDIFYKVNMFDYNFKQVGSTKFFINLFQIAFWVYFVVVAITAIVLLVKRCKSGGENVKNKTLLISLIMQIVCILFVVAVYIFATMSIDLCFYEAGYFLAGVPFVFAVGTIIAMVKIKKKRSKEAAENLE